MKIKSALFTTALALAATVIIYDGARAQNGAPDAPRPPHGQWGQRAMKNAPLKREDVIARTKAMFAKLDPQNTGSITPESVRALVEKKMAEHRAKSFDRLDTNHDGMISKDEFMAARMPQQKMGDMPPPPEGAAPPPGEGKRMVHGMRFRDRGHRMMGMMAGHMMLHRLFTEADTNHDGKLTLDEVLAYRLAKFDAADTNHDGVISPEERQAAVKAAVEKWRAAHPAK